MFIFLISLRWDVPLSATGIWALALLGASLGFLLFNWQPAKIFLGEGGSIFIGFTLGVLSIITGSKIITTLLVMGIPILDVIWVIIQRLLSHKSPFSGDRGHLHYRLLALGLTKKQAVLLLYFIALGFGSLGIISSSYGKMILVVCLITVMVIISVVLKLKINKAAKTVCLLLVCFFSLTILSGCGLNKVRSVVIGETTIQAEVAVDDKEWVAGLSGREKIAENSGMLFIFNDYASRTFWMKDMKFPLDIIWISDGKIVGVETAAPPSVNQPFETYSSPGPVNMVLEVNAGTVKKKGIKVGEVALIK
jgi:uncharacterized membrane protein (UPF0127 family)